MATKAEIEAAKAREAEDAAAEKQENAAPEQPKGENRSNMPAEQRPPGDLRRRTRREKRKGPFVKYVGSAAQRKINFTHWKSLGIDLDDNKRGVDDVWDVSNDKMIEAAKFNDAQLDYLLIDDLQQGTNTHAFLLVDYDYNEQLVQVAYE